MAAQTPRADGPPVRAVKCGRLLDVKAGRIITNAVVLTQGGTIVQAGANVTIPAGGEVIDLGNAFVLPGLLDAHTHLLLNYQPGTGSDKKIYLVPSDFPAEGYPSPPSPNLPAAERQQYEQGPKAS